MKRIFFFFLALILSQDLVFNHLQAQQTPVDEAVFGGMQWRLVGPYRGGRAGTVTGVPGQPNIYYL